MAITVGGVAIDLEASAAIVVKEMERAARATLDASQRMQRETRNVSTSFARLDQSVGRGVTAAATALKSFAVGLGAAFGATSIAGIVQVGTAALKSAGDLTELSQQAGVTVEQLQTLSFAGVQAGVSQEQLVTSLAQFGRRVGEAAQGTGALKKVLDQYNISITDANGQTRNSADILVSLAQVIGQAGSEQERLRISQAALGRGGATLLPVLLALADGYETIAAQARAAGIISDDYARKADQAADTIASLQYAFGQGFKIGLIKSFNDELKTTTGNLAAARGAGETLGSVLTGALNQAIESIRTTKQEYQALKSLFESIISTAGIDTFLAKLAAGIAAPFDALEAHTGVKGVRLPDPTKMFEQPSRPSIQINKPRLLRTGEVAGPPPPPPPPSAEQTSLAEARTRLLEQYQRENEQLIALKAAYEGYGASIEQVTAAAEFHDQLAAAGITQKQAEADGTIALWRANVNLKDSIEAIRSAKEAQAKLDADGRQLAEANRNAAQVYGDELERIETLLRAGSISQDEANQATIIAKEALTGADSAARVYVETLVDLNELLEQGKISQEEFNAAAQQARDKMQGTKETAEEVSLAYDLARETSELFARSVASGFTDAIFAGKGLQQTLNDIGMALAKAVLEAIIFKSIMAAIGGPATGTQGATGMYAMFGVGGAQPRQHGGPVRAGMSYIVGEHGREKFVPSQSGTIIPNNMLDKGGGGINGVTIVDQRGRNAPAIEQNVDARGMLSILVRSELNSMGRDGSLSRLTGTQRPGIARG